MTYEVLKRVDHIGCFSSDPKVKLYCIFGSSKRLNHDYPNLDEVAIALDESNHYFKGKNASMSIFSKPKHDFKCEVEVNGRILIATCKSMKVRQSKRRK